MEDDVEDVEDDVEDVEDNVDVVDVGVADVFTAGEAPVL